MAKPPTQSFLARKFDVCRKTIQNILQQLGVKRLKKQKYLSLSEKQKTPRVDRGKLFLRYLSHRKLRLVVTVNEMRVSTEDIDGQKYFYFDGKKVVIPYAWRKLERQNWPKDVMTAMGISWGKYHAHLYRPKWSESER